MEAAHELIEVTGVSWACRSLGISRASFYRFRSPKLDRSASRKGPRPERSLSESERQQVLEVLHADRGSSMKSKEVAMLLADLDITKTHSRPHVSNDNPYSES